MNILVVLLAFFPRPQISPIGQAEVAAARQMQMEVAAPAAKLSAWDSPMASRVTGRFVVGYEPGEVAAARAWIAQQGGAVARVDDVCGFVVADFPQACESQDGQLAQSASRAIGVRYFEPNTRIAAAGLPNDPYFIPHQWDKWVMYADQAWDIVGGSMDVKVAVIDVGVDYQHPDLVASFKTGEPGYDFIGNDNDPRPDDPGVRESFHGTHVAGIIAATRDNNVGIAGWSLVQLLSVRVLDDSGSGTTDVVASGVRWAADNGARVMNMSLTSSTNSTPLDQACRYAAQAGVVIVAASGNEGRQAIGYPAALSQCIAVGATSDSSRLVWFSNYGPEQELVAPGTRVLSCIPGGAYAQSQGTSMASPQVAGVAALVLARNWGLSASEVRAILSASAIDMGVAGRDVQYGYGLVNAKRAVDLAAAYGANRASLTVSGESHTAEVRTAIVRGGAGLPPWLEQADVFDGSGRRVQTGRSNLGPGMYFIRAGTKDDGQRTKDEGPGPRSGVVRRLLVLD